MGLRTLVETDPKTELRSFEAIKEVRETYKEYIDVEISRVYTLPCRSSGRP